MGSLPIFGYELSELEKQLKNESGGTSFGTDYSDKVRQGPTCREAIAGPSSSAANQPNSYTAVSFHVEPRSKPSTLSSHKWLWCNS